MKLSKAVEGYRLASLADGKSPVTMDGYEWAFNRIIKFFDDPEIDKLTLNDLKRLFLYLNTESGLASSSIQSIWRTIRSFYNWASGDFNLNRPDKEIPMPEVDTRVIVPYTETEIQTLLKACEHTALSKTANRKAFR